MGNQHNFPDWETVMKTYPVLRSTLDGIFSSAVGLSDEEATASFAKDLGHKPFRDVLRAELGAALADGSVSWKALLEECDVAYFDSEDEARSFVTQRIKEPAEAYSDI